MDNDMHVGSRIRILFQPYVTKQLEFVFGKGYTVG